MKRLQKKILNIIYAFKTMSFVKHILIFYLSITVIGSLLLFASFSHHDSANVTYIDALFTAASAFSDTGLNTVNTAATFNNFGQAVVSLLILIGGIGWFALKFYVINIIFGRPLSFASRDALAGERGSSKVGFTKHLIKVSVSILLVTIVIAAFILTLLFFYTSPDANPYGLTGNRLGQGLDGKDMVFENPHGNFLVSFKFGVFHAISAINNAGFDIIGGNSVAPYYRDYPVQIVFIILFVMGGVGYPVFYDIFLWFRSRKTKEEFKWSLFTKLSSITYILVSLIGITSTFAIEASLKNQMVFLGSDSHEVYSFWNNPMYGNHAEKSMAIIFNSMSTRNAGFSTIRFGDLAQTSVTICSILMFIGSAPSSTAGGIRTTTFALIVLGLWGKVRGRDEVRVFNRRISSEAVNRSFIVFVVSVFLLITGSIIGFTSFSSEGGLVNSSPSHLFKSNATDGFVNTPYTFNELVFEFASAFGTTGLTGGITPILSTASKITLILLMFIGQLGVSSSILVWRARSPKAKKYNYVEEDMTIG